MVSVIKKFAFCIIFAVAVILNAATPQSKIPAEAIAVMSVDLDKVLAWPFFQSFGAELLQGTLEQHQLNFQDLQGKIALGLTVPAPATLNNVNVDAVILLKKPNAEKLFELIGNFLSLAQPTGIKTDKNDIIGKDFKLSLVSPRELTFQMNTGNQVKFAELKSNKNLFSQLQQQNADIIIALDNQKLFTAFTDLLKQSRYWTDDMLQLLKDKNFSEMACFLKADGSIEIKQKETFASPANAKAALELAQEKLAEWKNNPMRAEIAKKIKLKTDGAVLHTEIELNAMDINSAFGAIMMEIGTPQKTRPGSLIR